MKIRMMGAALLAATTFPFTATPASAHGWCDAVAGWAPEQGLRQLTGGGGVTCSTGHVHFEIEICFLWSAVEQAGYLPQSCQTVVRDDGNSYWSVGAIAEQYCPYLSGYWRTRVTAVVDSHVVVDAALSPSALIVSNCGV